MPLLLPLFCGGGSDGDVVVVLLAPDRLRLFHRLETVLNLPRGFRVFVVVAR